MNIKKMFSLDLINPSITAKTKDELFQIIGTDLYEKKFVNDGYIKGITLREEKFPTGLITQNLNIALPHSDTDYVEKPFIYVVRLQGAPLIFNQMGDNREMEVKNIFFLGIKEPSNQVTLLSRLMELFSNDSFIDEYIHAEKKEDFYRILNQYI